MFLYYVFAKIFSLNADYTLSWVRSKKLNKRLNRGPCRNRSYKVLFLSSHLHHPHQSLKSTENPSIIGISEKKNPAAVNHIYPKRFLPFLPLSIPFLQQKNLDSLVRCRISLKESLLFFSPIRFLVEFFISPIILCAYELVFFRWKGWWRWKERKRRAFVFEFGYRIRLVVVIK